MAAQGNGNMLIAKSMGFESRARTMTSSLPSCSIRPSLDFDMKQYQAFLEIASPRELEEDLLFPSTWSCIK